MSLLLGVSAVFEAITGLAALSLENGAEICSADRDFGLFPGVRHLNPLG